MIDESNTEYSSLDPNIQINFDQCLFKPAQITLDLEIELEKAEEAKRNKQN
jgi:hypothetical protein